MPDKHKIETVIINGEEEIIVYKNTSIGDTVYDKNSETVYEADIWNADDLNWIVVSNNIN